MHPLERCGLAVREMLLTSAAGAPVPAAPPATRGPGSRYSSGYKSEGQGISATCRPVDVDQRRRADKGRAPLTPPRVSGRSDPSQHSSRGEEDAQWQGREGERGRERQHSGRRDGSQSSPSIPLMPTWPLPPLEASSQRGQHHPQGDHTLSRNHTMGSSGSRASLSPPPASLSPPGRAFAAGVETCLLLERVNGLDLRRSTTARSPTSSTSLREPAAYVGAKSPEAGAGNVAGKGQRASASSIGGSSSMRPQHSYSSSASAIMASMSPRDMAAVPRLFEQYAQLTRDAHRDRGAVDMAVTQVASGRQRMLSCESFGRQGTQAEGRRAEKSACFSDSGLGGAQGPGQQQRGREKSRSKQKSRARSINSKSRSVTPQRPPASPHAAVIPPGPHVGADTHTDDQAPVGRQLSSGTVAARGCEHVTNHATDRNLGLPVKHAKESVTIHGTSGRSQTPARSALKCSSKSEEFSVVRSRQVQFQNDSYV